MVDNKSLLGLPNVLPFMDAVSELPQPVSTVALKTVNNIYQPGT